MATYFSINDGNFDNPSVFVTTLSSGDVTAGTVGNLLTTAYSYPTILATSNGSTYYGIGLQLSARSVAPVGTIDLILSGTDGVSTTVSCPVSGLTPYNGSNNITAAYPLGWQLFAFDSPITIANTKTMRVGVKTSSSDQVSLIGASLAALNRYYVTTTNGTPSTSTDVTHVVGNLTTSGLVNKTVNYNVVGPSTLGNFYVHNGGILNFDPTTNINFTLIGAQGMQITPSGVVNIGTSGTPVAADKVHTVNLNNCFINVHNGASFNTYGAYKTPYALISSATVAGVSAYPLSTDISTWIADSVSTSAADVLVITPNSTAYNTSQTTFANTKNLDGSIKVWNAATFSHISSNYIPSIVNMTRNVRLSGANTTFGYVRFLDGSNSNLNNTYFTGMRNATYKGLVFCTNSTGSVSLSNCAFQGNAVASMPAFSFDATKTPTTNVSIKGCNFSGFGATTDIITLNGLSANNFTFTDNIVVGATQNGMLINGLSSTYANIKNNFLIGSTQNGLYVTNPYVLSGTIGGVGCMNAVCGSVVAGTRTISQFDGLAGYYNGTAGVNILGTIPQLSSTTFSNVTGNNNKTSGVVLSGNTNNLLTPIKININGLIANNNLSAGFFGYSITGNLSSMLFDNNALENMQVSIGNGDTIFDKLTSTNTSSIVAPAKTTNVNILSGLNYSSTLFKNCLLTGNLINAIKLNDTKFEQFSMDSSTLSSNTGDMGISTSLNFLQGSYQFNNCTFGTGILSTVTNDYQPEVFTENGFVVMKENGVANKHYKLLRAGKISLDTTFAYGSNTVSEKLEPASSTIQLRCGSKMIPVNKDTSYTVSCYIYKSSGYSGAAPRLMLKRNIPLGYQDTVLATSVLANGSWEQLTGVVPAALDQGIFEVYVDCSGNAGSGSVNIDNWSLV
jgi:hypothetical protein